MYPSCDLDRRSHVLNPLFLYYEISFLGKIYFCWMLFTDCTYVTGAGFVERKGFEHSKS